MSQNILSCYKIEETFKYNSTDWKFVFQISKDSFLLTLHKIHYYIYQQNFNYYYLSSLFRNQKQYQRNN